MIGGMEDEEREKNNNGNGTHGEQNKMRHGEGRR